MESLKREAKQIQLDLLKEDFENKKVTLEKRVATVVEEEDVRNNAKKTAAIKQLNEVLKTLNDQDKKVVEKS